MKGEELVAFYEKILAYNTNNAPPRDAAPKQETSGKSDGSTRPVKKTASTTPNMIVVCNVRILKDDVCLLLETRVPTDWLGRDY